MKMTRTTMCELSDREIQACHTLGIPVGDGSPDGDGSKRVCRSTTEGGTKGDRAGVLHNARMECMAPGIHQGYRDRTP